MGDNGFYAGTVSAPLASPMAGGCPPPSRRKPGGCILEGVGFRGIERLLGVSHVSVMNWIKARAQAMPPLPGVDPAEVEWVECDELCTFIGKKSLLLALVGY